MDIDIPLARPSPDTVRKPMKTLLSIILITLLATIIHAEETPWTRHTIDAVEKEAGKAGADGVRLGDLNKDGLPDIVTGWEEGGAIRVCLNPGFDRAKLHWPSVTVGKVRSPEDAVLVDLDANGVLDVVSSTEGKERSIFFHWAPELKSITDANQWKTDVLPASEKIEAWMFTLPFDVDQDGDMDLISGSKSTGASISWFENPGGENSRDVEKWTIHRATDAAWIMSLRILEVGSEKFLAYSDRKGDRSGIYLIPFLKKEPWLGKPVLIGASGEEVMFLDLALINDDEKPDIVAALRPDKIRIFHHPENTLSLWENTSELEPLSSDKHGTAKAVRVGNLDDADAPEYIITCEHANGQKHGTMMYQQSSGYSTISGPEGVKFDRIELLDLDGDSDLDVLTCEEREGLGVFWYENPANRK